MAKVYAFVVNKGGSGKTTISTNLAAAYHLKYPEKRILLLEADGQGNASLTFKINPDNLTTTLYECMVDGAPAQKAIQTIRPNFDLLPANDLMNFFELDVLPNLKGRNPFTFLKNVVDPIHDQYDVIFVDSPPEMKVIAGNILMIADYVYIPFKPESLSVAGLIRVIEKIQDSKETLGANPKIGGVIGSMIRHTRLHSDMMLQADAYCKKKGIRLLNTRVPESIRYADALELFGMPEVFADPNGRYAKVFFDLLEEVIMDE